jgi:hypothetical protein
MTDKAETEADRTEPPRAPPRRPWHAPQFSLTEVASTYAQGGTITDGDVTNGT